MNTPSGTQLTFQHQNCKTNEPHEHVYLLSHTTQKGPLQPSTIGKTFKLLFFSFQEQFWKQIGEVLYIAHNNKEERGKNVSFILDQ